MSDFNRKCKVLGREFVLSRLRELFGRLENVEFAVVFGSLARDGFTSHDVDIAVKFSGEVGLLELGWVVVKVAETLNISEDLVDVIDLDRVHPQLLLNVLREGFVVKGDKEELESFVRKAEFYSDALVELREWGTLDPNPKPNKAILNSRVEEIRRNMNFLRENILRKDVSEFGYGDILMLERAMHRLIEAMLDICGHLVSIYSFRVCGKLRRVCLEACQRWKNVKRPS